MPRQRAQPPLEASNRAVAWHLCPGRRALPPPTAAGPQTAAAVRCRLPQLACSNRWASPPLAAAGTPPFDAAAIRRSRRPQSRRPPPSNAAVVCLSRRPPPRRPSSCNSSHPPPPQQSSAAASSVAAAIRRGTVAAVVLCTAATTFLYFPLDLLFGSVYGFTPKTMQRRLLSGVHTGPVPTRAGDRDVGTIWVRCGLVTEFAEPTNRARLIRVYVVALITVSNGLCDPSLQPYSP